MAGSYFGKYRGMVTDNRDDQNRGRIQVSVPNVHEQEVTAEPALPYGVFFVPENKTGVWIEFEGGDSSKALWTGVVSIEGQWPSEAKVDPPQNRVIKTAAGHLLIFDDKGGEEGITIQEGKNQYSITLDSKGVTVKSNASSGPSIKLAADGVTIDGGNNPVKILGQGVTIDGGKQQPVTISGLGITINGGVQSVQISGSITAPVLLGTGASLPVLRLGKAIGNMGAPIVETPPPSVVLVS